MPLRLISALCEEYRRIPEPKARPVWEVLLGFVIGVGITLSIFVVFYLTSSFLDA